MGLKRVVSTDFWTDSKVIDMFSVEDKYFMLYLLTNPHTTQLGIYELNIKQASFETGYTADVITVLLERFENKYGLIKYSKATKEVAIGNYLRHSIMKGGKPVEDLLNRELQRVKDKNLIDYSFNKIKNHDDLNETVIKIIESLSNYNENENDNENGESCHVRTTNRVTYVNPSEIVDMYNDICTSFPKCLKITSKRINDIKARIKTNGIDEIKTAFVKAENSDFLKGKSELGWKANFDWIMKESNMTKILEGNYDGKKGVKRENEQVGRVPEQPGGIEDLTPEQRKAFGIE